MQITKSIHRTLLAGTLVAASAAIALADFPNRNIEIIHPWNLLSENLAKLDYRD